MAYYRGDYYRGDYYRGRRGRPAGDPFLGALAGFAAPFVRTIGSAVVGGVKKIFSGAAGQAVPRVPTSTPPLMPPIPLPSPIPAASTALAGPIVRGVGTAAGLAAGAGLVIDMMTGQVVHQRRRRMNPANPKALRRSLRRVAGFGKLAARAKRDVARAASSLGVKRGPRVNITQKRISARN